MNNPKNDKAISIMIKTQGNRRLKVMVRIRVGLPLFYSELCSTD